MWKIPLFDSSLGPEEAEAAGDIVKSGWLTMGEKVVTFEREFANYIGTDYAIAVSNCTAGIYLATKALGVGPSDEVICPSLTFVASANAITSLGAVPVFADIADTHCLSLNAAEIEKRITRRTKAIHVMHYGGTPIDLRGITEVASKHGVSVIEDCAHAPGAEINGARCGSQSDAGVFSFFSNKNMTTGEGGMITTNNSDLAERIRLMRSHGMTSGTWERHTQQTFGYDVIDLGLNFRLDEMRAAIGLIQLNKLDEHNERRGRLVGLYRSNLSGVQGVKIPLTNMPGKSAHHLFIVLLEPGIDRDLIAKMLNESGIQTSMHYPPIHQFSYYREVFERQEGKLPNTEAVANRLLTLPLYPSMSDDDVALVCESLITAIAMMPNTRQVYD